MNELILGVTSTCCVCGIPFEMPSKLYWTRQEDGKEFWCPNGHSQSFTKTRAEELQEQLGAANAKIMRLESCKRELENKNSNLIKKNNRLAKRDADKSGKTTKKVANKKAIKKKG